MTNTPKQPDPHTRFMSMREGASYAGISVANLWSIAGRGELPLIRIGRRTLVDRTDLDEFMLARKTKVA
ncbi:MAG: helix-turn-helix domain-containing protein [Aestuariivirga sp.]|uniref:helix-turn-helix domain-containing protein n=1 Tax=Aestuariivirga sp. TaxID=2650926 RepID=UPI0030197824